MKRKILIISILLLELAFSHFSPAAVGQDKEVMVPLEEIKSSCYGEIDMSKAEFELSEVGEECVNEGWLKKQESEAEDKTSKEKAELKEARVEVDNPPKVLTVPKSAVMEERRAEFSEERQNKEEVKVSVSWIKDSWLADNRPELAKTAVLKLLGDQPTIKEVVQTINTPRQLSQFMGSYFTMGSPEGRDGITAYSPSKMLETKLGDCKDWATFSAYILKWNGYDSYRLIRPLHPMDDGHVLTAWKDTQGRYNLLNFTDMYLTVGETKEAAISFLENHAQQYSDAGYNEIYAYDFLDPLTPLNVRTGIAPVLTEKILVTVPYADNVDLKLELKEDNLHSLWGRIVQIEKTDPKRHKLIFVIDLEHNFKKASREFILTEIVTSPNTDYFLYNWAKGENEEGNFGEAVRLGTKAMIHIRGKITKINNSKKLIAETISS